MGRLTPQFRVGLPAGAMSIYADLDVGLWMAACDDGDGVGEGLVARDVSGEWLSLMVPDGWDGGWDGDRGLR